jgi:hypothetical protein
MPPSPGPAQPDTTAPAAEASPSPPAVDVTINISDLSSTAESLPPTTAGSAQPKNDGSAENSFESAPDSFEQTKGFSFDQDFGSFGSPQKSFAYQNFPQKDYRYNFPTKFDGGYEFQPAPLHQEYHQQYVDFGTPSAQFLPAPKVSYTGFPTTYNNHHFGPSSHLAKSSVKMPHAAYEHITYHDNSGEFNGGYQNHHY